MYAFSCTLVKDAFASLWQNRKGSSGHGTYQHLTPHHYVLPVCHRVDDQLNMVEQQPSDIHKAVYDFSNGPVGQATSKGVQVAAKLTMTATIEAAKVAAPVGKWALQQGFKAAVGLVGAAIQQESKQKQQQKNKQQGNGKGPVDKRR